jgi:uncharacterized damage-inducible protein DinB
MHDMAARRLESFAISGGNLPDDGARRSAKLDLMTYDELNLLVDYNYWARDRVLDAAAALSGEQFTRDMGNSFGSVRDTIAHICDAESIWLSRWKSQQPTGFRSPDRIPDVAAARKEWAELERGVREVLENLGPAGVQRTFEYKDLKGAARSDVFWQMLQHVVNHGSYHRGQVTTMLRQLGVAPPKSMDLIGFYRERRQKT